MTVSTSINSVVYRGNGATTQFAMPFKVLDEDHFVVTRRDYTTGEVLYTYVGTDYTYSGIGDDSGTLTLAGTALDDDYELVIERIVPYTQDLDIVNAGGFYPDTVEEQLDLMTMGIQQIADRAGRGAYVPVGEEGLALPKASDRAGLFFGFDAGGDFVALSGTGADAGLRADLAESSGSALIGYGAGTVEDALERVSISVLDYGAVGDGSTNDTVAIQACIDANKGKDIRFPAGYTYFAAGLLLSGSTYNNTRLIIEGTFKLRVRTVDNFLTTFAGIIFQSCDGCSLVVNGVMDGNRAAQPANEQCHLVVLAGVTNFRAEDGWRIKQIRGDGFLLICAANSTGANNDNVYIGKGIGENSADDGRNLVSVCSGLNVIVAGGVSKKIGGTISAVRMPGGFNCEPDAGTLHRVTNLHVGPWVIETAGVGGFVMLGQSITGVDATMDWTISNVTFEQFIVTTASGLTGGPLFRRINGVAGSGMFIRTGTRTPGIDCDYLNNAKLDFPKISGCSDALTLGFNGTVYDSEISANVTDHSGSAILVVGAERCDLKLRCRNPQGAGSYGFNIDPGARTLTQVGVTYVIDCPYDANLTVAIRCDGITFGEGTNLAGGTLTGYATKTEQLAGSPVLPSFRVKGRNTGTAVPTTGTWADGDVVWNTAPAAAGVPGWVCTTPGDAGTFVFKAMAVLAA